MRGACAARNAHYFGQGQAPRPHLDLEVLDPEFNHYWRNIAYERQARADRSKDSTSKDSTEKWFFDLQTFMDIGYRSLSTKYFGGGETGGLDPNDYIGAISTSTSWRPRFIIADQRTSSGNTGWLGSREPLATGSEQFDKRFRVMATHHDFTRTFLDDAVRAVLLRLPEGSVVEVVGPYVLFLALADGRLPFALEPIMDEFERKVPLFADTWPAQT